MTETQRNPTSGGSGRSARFSFHRFRAIFVALGLVVCLVALAFAPVAQPAKALDWEDVDSPLTGLGTGALVGAAFGPLGALAGAAVGGIFGLVMESLQNDKYKAAALSNEKIVYARNLGSVLHNYLNITHAHAHDELELYNTSTYFFVRKAEWAAWSLYDYQTQHDLTYEYDADYVLSKSKVANQTLLYQWLVAESYNAIINGYTDLSQSFIGTYEGMSWGYVAYHSTYTNVVASSLGTNDYIDIKFTNKVTDCGETNWVFINPDNPIYMVRRSATPVDADVRITSWDGTIVYEHTYTDKTVEDVIVIDLADMHLPAGRYQLHSPTYQANTMFFTLATSALANSASIYPAILVTIKTDESATLGCVTWFEDSTGNTVNSQNKFSTPTNYPRARFYRQTPMSIQGSISSNDGYDLPLSIYLQDVTAAQAKQTEMLTTCNNFAQTYYNALVAGGGTPYPQPDIIFPDPNQMADLTPEQLYAIYLAYLNQMYEWFQDYSYMDTSHVNISASSLDLVCRGAIYNDTGAKVYSNLTVFTPYISIEDMHIELGDNNTLAQPGFLIIWGEKDSMANETWIRRNITYVSVTAGWNMSIEEMWYKGEPVTEAWLNVTQLSFVLPDTPNPITPPQGMSDLEWLMEHWYLIAGVLGIIFLLVALSVRRWEIALIGIILIAAAVAGYYLEGGLTGLVWPFELRS
ncbi:MAG: hypothetical protein PHV99_03710 [Candidatus Pacebacteria bacterium]|nr:hypothetical protein [Candidatus Paceibacterota bacterium]